MTVEVPPEAMEAAIRAMAAAVQNPESLAPKLFAAVERVHARRARQETVEPQSPTAHAEGRKTLWKTGMLWLSLIENTQHSIREVNGPSFSFGTTRPYAPYLRDGAVIVPRWARTLKFQIAGEWKSSDLVVLPPRDFIGLFTDQEVEEVNDVVRAWLLEVGREAAIAAGGDLQVTGIEPKES